jgi:hypothetical protein
MAKEPIRETGKTYSPSGLTVKDLNDFYDKFFAMPRKTGKFNKKIYGYAVEELRLLGIVCQVGKENRVLKELMSEQEGRITELEEMVSQIVKNGIVAPSEESDKPCADEEDDVVVGKTISEEGTGFEMYFVGADELFLG